ncbi:MAG: hypothetical protein K6G16_10635 [Lachnospiraceae bacterium]|nr:hypothetical protein [Lachnospiraceae bacterium]
MPGKLTTTYSNEIRDYINMPIGDDASMFLSTCQPLLPDGELMNDLLAEHGEPGMIYDVNRYDEEEGRNSLPHAMGKGTEMIWLNNGLDKQAMWADFKKAVAETEEKFAQHTGPGDEQIVDYANAVVFNPAKRALNGWPIFKTVERLNLASWHKEFGAYINLGSGEEMRKKLAWCEANFPLPRMVIDIDKAIGMHTDYFDTVEKGEMTPELEAEYRERLLEQETRILSGLERVASVTSAEEGQRIKELSGIGNGAHNFNRYASRGLRLTYSDTEARIAGLKNGWPIEDLNALSSYKYAMDSMYRIAFYTENENLEMRDMPVFKEGQQEYLTRMQQLWAKIESTPVKDNAARKALLTEMRTLAQEGVEREFIATQKLSAEEPEFSYLLYDIDRKIARQLTPSEQQVMEHGETYDQEAYAAFRQTLTDAERIRREDYKRAQEAERRRREEEQLKQEAEQRSAEDAERDREAGALIDVIFDNVLEVAGQRPYDDVIREAWERRNAIPTREELEERRLDNNVGGDVWFYSALREKRAEARRNTPINKGNRPSSDQNDLLRHYMGKSDRDFTDALNLKLESAEERRKIAEEYYDDLIAHPFQNVPESEAIANARYFGELDARAARNIAAEELPAFDPADPAQVKNIARSELGALATFVTDFFQNDQNLRQNSNPSSPLRAAYEGAFGTREEYARLYGQLSVSSAIVSLANVVNTDGLDPMHKAVALHFLQKYGGELKGKKLTEVPADKWMEINAVGSAIWKTLSEPQYLPAEGAPSQEALAAFLAGGPSPFTPEYIAKLDTLITEYKKLTPAQESADQVKKVLTGAADMARIYNLDYIDLREGPQKRLDLNQLVSMSDGEKAKTHRIFDQTLGVLVLVNGQQPMLAAVRGESTLDRFSVNGVKMSALMEDLYGRDRMALMSPADRQTAMEAILLQAIADPSHTIVYTPLNYGPDGSIVEQQPVTIPRPVPQRVAEKPIQPADDEIRFEHGVARAEQHAQKLDSFLPGAYAAFGKNRLVGQLVQAQAPEQIKDIKKNFMEDYAQSAEVLADAVAEVRPQMAVYLRLQANIAKRSIATPMPADSYPYNTLMNLVDQIHLPLPDVLDERKPGPVFRVIADEPDGLNPFPVLEAAQSAERLMNLTAAHTAKLRDAGAPATAEEDKNARLEILKEITILEGHLDEMERVAGLKRRGPALGEAFDDPQAVNRFMNGNPGLAAMRAELNGRRTALMNGWPVEDADLIAGFYAKREVLWQAVRDLPEGSENRLAYERAARALEEICDRIGTTTVEDSETRTRLLENINSYGPAIYNDIASRAGAPEQGQTLALQNAVTKAMQAQIPASAFRSSEECTAITEQAQAHWKETRKKAQENEEARRARAAEVRKAKGKGQDQQGQKNPEPRVNRSASADKRATWAADLFNGVEVRERREQQRADRDQDYDPNDFYDQTFDETFAGADEREVSGFFVSDEYLRMLSEDENFFGGLFDQEFQEEATNDLYGNGLIFGFFEWKDMKQRLSTLSSGPCQGLLLKTDRLNSLTNDMRAWAMVTKGLSFDEACEINTANLRERRQLAAEFLDDLEAHPLNRNMTESERELSATYYAYIHSTALNRFLETDFPEIDLSDRGFRQRIRAMSQFAVDINQDTKELFMSSDPVVRSAYLRGMGGREACTCAHAKISLPQVLGGLVADIVDTPTHEYYPLRNKAFLKLQLERVNTLMRGKKLSDAPLGLGEYLAQLEVRITSMPLPAEGAPSEQALQDYLDGKIPSPFTEAYLNAVTPPLDRQIADHVAGQSRGSVENVLSGASKPLENAGDIYNLPYIPIGPAAERPQPDYVTMSDGVLRDTDVIFDRIFGEALDSQTNAQIRLSAMRGETLTDRFRIDGQRVSELPALQAARENRTPEDFQIICEAEILRALGDPARKVTYVGLAIDEHQQVVERPPVTIPDPAPAAFPVEEADLDPAVAGSEETRRIMKYTMGYNKVTTDLSDYQGLYDGDPLLDPFKHAEKLEDPMFYRSDGEEDGEMRFGAGNYRGISYSQGDVIGYKMLHGMQEDGTLTAEGERNLKKLTEQMNALYDRIEEAAAEWDAREPMLAEMFRLKKNSVTTEERGLPWTDLKENYTFMNMGSQTAKLHIAPPSTGIPYDQTQAMRAIQGYPTGALKYPLPQAITATGRMVQAEAAQIRARREGTLTRQQDRMNRRLMLTEIEEIEKQLRRLDALYLSSVDENGKPDPTKPGLAHVAHLNRFLENPVFESSSYHPRGTRLVHVDLDARRRLLAQGWPIEDLNGLTNLYIDRDALRKYLDNPANEKKLTPEKLLEKRRALKVLDEVCGYLDRKEITNAADRDQALDHIIGYGTLLFNDTVFGDNEVRDAMQKKIAETRARRMLEEQFLTGQERNEYKESFAAYQAQAGQEELKPTMNAPQTDEERAFLNAEHLSRLYEAAGQLEADPAVENDPALSQARHEVQIYCAHVENFYKKSEFLDPDRAEDRRNAFEDLMQRSTKLVTALDDAEDKLTKNGTKTKFTKAEEKTLREFRQAKFAIDEMRRKYIAQVEYEQRRREDLLAMERAEAEKARIEAENARIEAERAYRNERYTVELDYAMAGLSQEDQERLIRLLTAPIPGTEHFDFETGQEIPAQPRELPERIRMDYDSEGNLVPEVFIEADRQARREAEAAAAAEAAEQARREAEARERTPEAIKRFARRNRRADREALALVGISPYDEGAADLFAMADQDYSAAEVTRRHRERTEEAKRRRELATATGNERYKWSFSHILQEAYDRSEDLQNAEDRIIHDPAALQEQITDAEISVRDAKKVYGQMTAAVIAAFPSSLLEDKIRELRPEWYEQTLLPLVEQGIGDLLPMYRKQPDARLGIINRVLLDEIPLKDRHSLLQALADALPVSMREELRVKLVTAAVPMNRPYHEQVTKPLAGRIDELLADPKPETGDIEAYRKILNDAKESLDEVRDDVLEYGKGRVSDYEYAHKFTRDHQIDAFLANSDESTRSVGNQMRKGDERLVRDGVLPVHEEAFNKLLHPVLSSDPSYQDAIAHMLLRMEEMGIEPTKTTEQGAKALAFADLVKSKAALRTAIEEGDPDAILETGRDYEKKRANMRELMDYAKEHFSKVSSPTNVDSTRNSSVPWEFAGDYFVSSQVNGVFQLYSALKAHGMSAQEFLSDPEAARRKMYERINEEHSLKKRMEGKSAGRILGELLAENDFQATTRKADVHWATMMVNCGIEAFTENDPNVAAREKKRVSHYLISNYQGAVNKVREESRNPFLMEDPAREAQVLHLLSVVSAEDLAANTDRFLSGGCYDAQGHRIPTITAEEYIAKAQNIDYLKLTDRSADIIREASAVDGTRFDAAIFMVEHQKTLATLLKARATDAGTLGFDMLEYELTHAAQIYDMIRAANPQRNLPALTDAQRQSMDETARRYEADRKRIHQMFSAQRRSAIARRRRNLGNIGARVRTAVTQREARRNREEERARLQEESARRRAESARLEEEERRQARERFRAEQVQRIIDQQRSDEAERRRVEHQTLPLTERLVLRGLQKIWADQEVGELAGQTSQQKAARDAKLTALDADRRMNALLKGVLGACAGDGLSYLPKARVTELLTQELGETRAAVLSAKLPGSIRNMDDLKNLKPKERAEVFATLAGTLTEEQRKECIALDDRFVSVYSMELTGAPYDDQMDPVRRNRIRQAFDRQLTEGDASRLVRDFKADIYNNGKETHKERMQFMAVLDEANRLLKPVDPTIKSTVDQVRRINENYTESEQKRLIGRSGQAPDHYYMQGLLEKRGNLRISGAEKTEDIRKLKAEKLSFDPDYIAQVTGMLKKMEAMQLLTGDTAGEEKTKLYAFRNVDQAQKELKEAIRSKDKERTLAAMEKLKAARRDMDELMKIAEEHFHPAEYMGNLDVMRNSRIPWDYARNAVASSQINAMYLLGNALKANGISIDEFAADPAEAVRRMERQMQEKYSTLQGFAVNKTPGALAADAATDIIANAVSGSAMAYGTLYWRTVEGLILAEPQTDERRRARNLLINSRINELNTENANYRQMKSLDTLKNGARETSAAGREAFRALMVVDPQDIDADRMFTDPAVAADGTRMEPFSLAGYLRDKAPMDYAAQAGRMETMLKDAATEVARLKTAAAEAAKKTDIDVTFNDFNSGAFSPYQMLKARQEALTELLVLRAHEKGEPGYQALVQELKELPERYERLRNAEPGLNLPALTKGQKDALKAGAKEFDRLTNDRTKLMDAEEKRIRTAETAKEKAFMRAIADKNREMKHHLDRMNDLLEQWASVEEIDAEEAAYNKARDEKERMLSARAQVIKDDFRSGRLPEGYASARIAQLAEMIRGGEPTEAPPLFGTAQADPQAESRRLKDRERFLTENLMESRGFRMRPEQTEIPAAMRDSLHTLSEPWALEIIQEQRAILGTGGAQAIPVGREAQLDALLEDDDMDENEMQEEGPRAGGEEPRREAPQGNGQPQNEQLRNEQPKVQDTSFADLAKQFDKKPQADRPRRNSVAGIPHQLQAGNINPENGQPADERQVDGKPLQGGGLGK